MKQPAPRAWFLVGMAVGAAAWAFASFAFFHLLRATAHLESEFAWGCIQAGSAVLVLLLALAAARRLER